MPTSPTAAETSAAECVANTLGGSFSVHDDGRSDGQYDFMIEVAGEHHALEVTSMTDAKRREFEAISAKLQRDEQVYDLRWAWLVKPTDKAASRIKKSMGLIVTFLSELESLGLLQLPRRRENEDLHEAARAAGIDQASVLQHWESGAVVINRDRVGSVIAYPDEAVAVVVASEAWKGDNLDKLARSASSRRHLFVEIDHSWMDGFGALNSNPFLPPAEAPELPEEITDIWLRSFDRTWWWDGSQWRDVAPATP